MPSHRPIKLAYPGLLSSLYLDLQYLHALKERAQSCCSYVSTMAVHSTTKPHLQKGFLIPLWTLQILVMLLIIISDIYLDTFTGFSP